MRHKPHARPKSQAPAEGRPRSGFSLDDIGAQNLVRILDGISLPVFTTNEDDHFVFINQAASRLLGQKRELLLGAKDTMLRAGRPADAESSFERVLLLDNCEHVVSITRSTAANSNDRANLVTGVVTDITGLRNTELACSLYAKRLELLLGELPVLLFAQDEHGAIRFWNRQCERVLGYTAQQVAADADIIGRLCPAPEDRAAMLDCAAGAEHEVNMRAADGSPRTIAWTVTPVTTLVAGCACFKTGIDRTGQKIAEQSLREAERRANALFQASPLGMHLYRLTAEGQLVFTGANPAADIILHRDHARFVGQPIEAVFPEMSGTEARERFRRACALGESWKTEQFDYHDDQISGAYELHCFQTEPGACACMFLDLTEHKRLETRLRHQALHDPLTGIANRTLCVERIDTALQRAKRRADYRHAVIFLDLDRFKNINDTLGHTAGDMVLVEIATRLRTAVRELDTVARMGGDEFVVVMEEFDSYKRPIQAIRRIRAALAEPIRAQGQDITVTASIGLALGQSPANSAEEVLRNANLAMHRAKAMGRNRVKSFTQSLLTQTIRVVRLENEMDRALARGEFFLEFQPIIQLGVGQQLFGFEALARWNHPERGLIMPGEFIPIAEDSGKVVELGYWALSEGSRILNQWRKRYPHLRDAMISVNLSPQQVPRPDFLPRMREILERTGLPAKNLKLEVTETALMQSGATVLNKLEELRDMGVSFSVDDFGTGYSSLAYLTRLPLDHLKIDLSFVQMLENGRENLEIVRAITQLATSLRMDVVAEGVETLGQQGILRDLGCEYFQGYLFARPLPEDKAEEFLRRFDKALSPGLGSSLCNMP